MLKLISLGVSYLIAFIAAVGLQVLSVGLLYSFENTQSWKLYLIQIEEEIKKTEEHQKLIGSYWQKWLEY